MISEYCRVIGKKEGLKVVGIAVDLTDDCICIEEAETNEVFMFEPSEVRAEKAIKFGKPALNIDPELEKKVLERLQEQKEKE